MIRQDKYGTVLNHHSTYRHIARLLGGSPTDVIVAWTDGQGTQLDILLAYKPLQYGSLQRGMDASTDLFVAVSGHSMFGFELNGRWKAPAYVGEKLRLGGQNATTIELAEFINGLCKELEK